MVYPRSRPGPDEISPFARYAPKPKPHSLIHDVYRLFWLYGLYRDIRYNVTVLTYPKASTYIGYMESDATRISRAIGSLLAIQRSAAPRPVLVLFLPDYNSWSYLAKHPGAYQQSVVVKVRAVLEDHGIRTIDLMKEFMDRGFVRETLYLPCDGHWNARGHQAAFDVVSPVLEDMLGRLNN